MQINPLKLLTTSVIHKLKPALNISKPLHLESPAFEIYIPKDSPAKPPLAKDSQHNVSNKQINFQKKSKQISPIASFKKKQK